MVDQIPKKRLLTEEEWRAIGVQQSRGWVHYAIHNPEPHILLFKRPHGIPLLRNETFFLGTNPQTGEVNIQEARKQAEKFRKGLLV